MPLIGGALLDCAKAYGSRAEQRAEKFALYFAVDMGLDSITYDCVERGVAIVKYEHGLKKYLMPFEANNDESSIQQRIMQMLYRAKGRVALRELEDVLHPARFGLSVWNKAMGQLQAQRYIVVT